MLYWAQAAGRNINGLDFICAAGAGAGRGCNCWRSCWPAADAVRPSRETAEDFVRAVTPVLQSETDLLAEQLRAMQGETARTTTAGLRDFSAVLAENQRQNAAASTARLDAIDRAGAARQKGGQRRDAGPADHAGKPHQEPGGFQRQPAGRGPGRAGAGGSM